MPSATVRKSKSYGGALVAAAAANGNDVDEGLTMEDVSPAAQAVAFGKDEEPAPKLPKGRRILDTTVRTDVDSLYRSVFGGDTFFEILSGKVYEELKSFAVSAWSKSGGVRERTMRYEIVKYIAFSRQVVQVQQTQVRAAYSRRGRVYGVDTVTKNSGVVYSDYFLIHIHYRMTADPQRPRERSRVEVVADIEFVKPCLFRGRIESETWGGLKKYYEVMENEIQTERDLREGVERGEVGGGGGEGPGVGAEAQDVGLRLKAGESRTRNGSSEAGKARGKRTAAAVTNGEADLRFDGDRSGAWAFRSGNASSYGSAGAETVASEQQGSPIGREVALCAFVLLIVTLFMLTLSMFKLSSAIVSLDERLSRMEEILLLTRVAGGGGAGEGAGRQGGEL